MDSSCILAIDQGTTSCRAILFNREGVNIGMAQKEITQYFPNSGWVEHDAKEIWATQLGVVFEALAVAQRKVEDVQAIGITNQRETTIVWDKKTSLPIHKAIVWQDRRTADMCTKLKADGFEEKVKKKTGLPIDPYFSATKIRWILDNVPNAREKAERNELAFGTVDSWLIWNLTKGNQHVTDITNASRTMLFNIETCEWDDELLDLFGIPKSMLPQIKASSERIGDWKGSGSETAIPIAGVAGDQHAALFGQLCTETGMAKNTYGTGCFVVLNTGKQIVRSTNNLISTIAWKIGNEVTYALEGSIFVGGAVVQWLRDKMKMIETASAIEPLVRGVMDSVNRNAVEQGKQAEVTNEEDPLVIVPAFVGLGAPYWQPQARGTMFGISRNTSPEHIARASLESIAYQSCDVLTAMAADLGHPIAELRVDGGAATNDWLMQFQADMLGINVSRPKITETTALGAAYLAGLAVGFWPDIASLQAQWKLDKCFQSKTTLEMRAKRLATWHRAVDATIH